MNKDIYQISDNLWMWEIRNDTGRLFFQSWEKTEAEANQKADEFKEKAKLSY